MRLDDVPPALVGLVASWRSADSKPQDAISWPRDRWIAALPDHTDTLRSLPDRLDQAAVRRACREAAAGPTQAVAAYIAVMVWGFGNVGYGPHRTREILAATADAPERLAATASRLVTDGPLGAYRCLTDDDDSRLAGLGPAFGTKYLYFCQPTSSRRSALILDAFVSEWLRCETGFWLNPVRWSLPTYRRYLERMHRWADAIGCAPDELESCIFRAEASGRRSQWAASAVDRPA